MLMAFGNDLIKLPDIRSEYPYYVLTSCESFKTLETGIIIRGDARSCRVEFWVMKKATMDCLLVLIWKHTGDGMKLHGLLKGLSARTGYIILWDMCWYVYSWRVWCTFIVLWYHQFLQCYYSLLGTRNWFIINHDHRWIQHCAMI